jgi:hypothetical protein
MRASACVLFALGLTCTFMADHVPVWMGAPPLPALVLLVQVAGALYLGFAAMNWMGRDQLIGGIYSRPLVIGNLLHFLTAGLAMLKVAASGTDLALLWPLTAVYLLLAAVFGSLLFRHPVAQAAST